MNWETKLVNDFGERKSILLYMGLLLVFLLAYWRHLLLLGLVPANGDAIPFHFSTWAIGKRLFHENQLLLWDAYRNFGQPFLASPQNQAFYPFRLLTAFLDYVDYQRISLVFHTLLGFVFMFLLVYKKSKRLEPSILAGLAFCFNGFVFYRIIYPSDISTYMWIPAACFFLENRNVVFLAVALSFQWLTGFVPYFILTCLLLAAHCLFSSDKRLALKTFSKAFLLFAGLTAFQLFPFIELMTQADRPMLLDASTALDDSVAPLSLVTNLFIPSFLRQPLMDTTPWMSRFYFSPLLLLIAGLALVRRWKSTWIWGIFGATALVLSLGQYLPFSDHALFLRVFRYQSHWLVLFAFVISVLGGLGLDTIKRLFIRRLALIILAFDFLVAANPAVFDWKGRQFFTEPSPPAFDVDSVRPRYRLFHSKEFLSRASSWKKTTESDWTAFRLTYHPSLAAAFGIREAVSYYTLVTRNSRNFRRRLIGENSSSPLFDKAGIRFMVSIEESSPSSGDQVKIIFTENPDAKDHLFFAKGGDVTIQKDRSGILTARVQGEGPLIFSESIYPGWSATVDGKKVSIEPYEDTFMKINLSPGDHDVSFVYRPASFMFGLAISAFTLALLVFFKSHLGFLIKRRAQGLRFLIAPRRKITNG